MDKKNDPSHRFFSAYTNWLDGFVTPNAERAVKRLRREPVEADELPPGIFLAELSIDELNELEMKSWFAIRSLVTVKDLAATEIEDREDPPEDEEDE